MNVEREYNGECLMNVEREYNGECLMNVEREYNGRMFDECRESIMGNV